MKRVKSHTIFIVFLLLTCLLTPLFAGSSDLDEELFGSSDSPLEEDLFGSPSSESLEADGDLDTLLFGEADSSELDLDALFSGDGESLVSEVEETTLNLTETLLTNDNGVTIGGSYSFSIGPGYSWNTDSETGTWVLSPSLGGKLFFDARPDADIRVFGKAEISYPFTVVEDDPATPMTNEYRSFSDIITIKELFSDFAINDTVFMRVGKQALNWGVGYFFSPANLLNLSQVDPENPDADLEGPLSIKANMPLGIDNIYGYIILPEAATEPADMAFAAKYEKVLGSSEVGIGAYYRDGQSPKAMATLSSSFGKISYFAEGVVSYGSDRTFVTSATAPYGLTTYEDTLFFSATLGGMYTWSADEGNFGLSIIAQYYYNGEGYSDTDLYPGIMASVLAGNISYSDISPLGKHYGAANLSFTFTDTISTGVFWYGNMGDLSGFVRPSITWSPVDFVTTSLSLYMNYGKEDKTEFTQMGHLLAPTFTISLGGTSF